MCMVQTAFPQCLVIIRRLGKRIWRLATGYGKQGASGTQTSEVQRPSRDHTITLRRNLYNVLAAAPSRDPTDAQQPSLPIRPVCAPESLSIT